MYTYIFCEDGESCAVDGVSNFHNIHEAISALQDDTSGNYSPGNKFVIVDFDSQECVFVEAQIKFTVLTK